MNILSVTQLPQSGLLNDEISLILDILFLYNPRISEILDLDISHCKNKSFITLKGKKRSADIIIRDRELVARIHALAAHRKDKIFIYTSYMQVYRFIKSNLQSIIASAPHTKNQKVTHAFRYLNAGSSYDENEVKSILHHNSAASGAFYNTHLRSTHNGKNIKRNTRAGKR